MEQGQTIQWFPGHMTKTRRKIQECLPLIDAVVEVLDARIPNSSRNPELDALTAGKPRLVVLNKADMADDTAGFWRSGLPLGRPKGWEDVLSALWLWGSPMSASPA